MFLDTSALYLLERHRAFEAELERDAVIARHRADIRAIHSGSDETDSACVDGFGGVALGDRASRRGDPRPNLGRP
jgi:hypothetical protein